MRIVQLNLAADFALTTPEELLERYHTLTGWSRAVMDAGADVRVVQRFTSAGLLQQEGIAYVFVHDRHEGLLTAWSVSNAAVTAVVEHAPDVVHINGLMFPAMIEAVRVAIGTRAAIVLQDHAGVVPSRAALAFTGHRWRRAFRTADGVTFTAAELAATWHAVGLPREVPVFEIPEASTTFEPIPRDVARARTGISGAPVLLWVGRLNANKDPMTVLAGVERVLPSLPEATLWCVVPADSPLHVIEQRLAASPTLRQRLHVVHGAPRTAMPLYYSASDILVSGSHHEGSGYAVIEAMACGVTPCVTDIPSFRRLADGSGMRWRPGDVQGCALAIAELARRISPAQRDVVRHDFSRRLSWDAIGRRTVAAYSEVVRLRRARQ